MSLKKPPNLRPYESLGKLVVSWRSQHQRSAAAFHRDHGISFSYKIYVEIEGGQHLPSVEQMIEIARALKISDTDAMQIWAREQMPTEELRAAFRTSNLPETFSPETQGAKPKLDNAWIFGKSEHAFLLKNPWFFEFCLRLALDFPNEVAFEHFGLKSQAHALRFADLYLKPWLLLGRIIQSSSGFSAAEPHVFIPQTPDWNDVRSRNFERAYEKISSKITPESIQKRNSFREIITRPLASELIAGWITELEKLEATFRVLPGTDAPMSSKKEAHSLLIAFAPRDLSLPASIVRECEPE